MTAAEESVRAGRLDDALADLQGQVRKKPADARLRTFLFQLLAIRGDWDRALTQLKVAVDLDAGALAILKTYEEAMRCEVLRAEVFAGRRTPLLFGKPSEWMALLVEALRLTAEGKFEEARTLREKAFESAPTTSGTISSQTTDETGEQKLSSQPFSWIADADQRLGPMLEAIVKGQYYWIPFSRLREIRIEKPTDLRDVAWTAANFLLVNGGEALGLIPTRYPGSQSASDPKLVMARGTEWIERPAETFLGVGQRLFATDQGEFGLMDLRVIKLDSVAETGGQGQEEEESEAQPAAEGAGPA